MRKLKLNLEELNVDSFAINEDEKERRGTVHGNVDYTHPKVCDTAMDCSFNTCFTYCATACGNSCVETCEFTCDMSCNYGSSC